MPAAATKSAAELLAFYIEAGADALVSETPADRFAEEEKAPAAAPPLAPAPPKAAAAHAFAPAAPPAPDAAAASARELARGVKTLDELRAAMTGFDGCALKSTATQLVFADGNPQAKLMFVGEAPGRDEDIEGLPFVGRSGQLLNRMLAAIGLDRTSVFIANIIPWRPPGNRDPSPQESQICLPFIERMIELSSAEILVCLGKPSAHTLLRTSEPITKLRGKWRTYQAGERTLRAVATFHPAFLLRSPIQKRFAWRDFMAIRKALDEVSNR